MRRPGLRPLVLLAPILLLLALAATSTPAQAAGNANAKIMLRAKLRSNHNNCRDVPATPSDCSGYDSGVHGLQLYPQTYYAYLLVVNGSQSEGVGGFQCGLQYDGGVDPIGGFTPISVYSWTL